MPETAPVSLDVVAFCQRAVKVGPVRGFIEVDGDEEGGEEAVQNSEDGVGEDKVENETCADEKFPRASMRMVDVAWSAQQPNKGWSGRGVHSRGTRKLAESYWPIACKSPHHCRFAY